MRNIVGNELIEMTLGNEMIMVYDSMFGQGKGKEVVNSCKESWLIHVGKASWCM
jgi:hypothetical protein